MSTVNNKFVNKSDSRAVFFCCSDKVYIPRAITALRSLEACCPHNDFFVATDTNQLTSHEMRVMEDFRTTPFHLELSEDFPTGVRKWQPIMYWIYAMPAILLKQGYKFSCAIDGDVLGLQPFDLQWLSSIRGIACVRNPPRWQSGGQLIKKHFGWFQKRYGITKAQIEKPNTNSGVLWFNNQAMVDSGFYEITADVYKHVTGQGWTDSWLNDQALFAIVTCILDDKLPISIIDDKWNYRFSVVLSNPEYKSMMKPPINICHFTGVKPWGSFISHFKSSWRYRELDLYRIQCVYKWRKFSRKLNFEFI
jgi:hypothetical protein